MFETLTTSPAGRAAVNSVAASAAGRTVAARLPAIPGSENGTVIRPTPSPPTPVPGICSTCVSVGPGLANVTFTQAWSDADARGRTGMHSRALFVQPHHAVELAGSLGDAPRQVLG